MLADTYTLNITNVFTDDGTGNIKTLNNGAVLQFKTPEDLRKKGKCHITVVGGGMYVVSDDAANTLYTTPKKTFFVFTSNISQLGYSTNTRGASNILGRCLYSYAYDAADPVKIPVLPLSSINNLSFSCRELPPVIEIERNVINSETNKLELVENANNQDYPYEITLQLVFEEDLKKPF